MDYLPLAHSNIMPTKNPMTPAVSDFDEIMKII